MKSQAQIIVTVGPFCESVVLLEEMMQSGMDIARINSAHGNYEKHKKYIENIKVPIILDLAGPRTDNENGHSFNPNSEYITDKDKKDIKFGIDNKVEYFGASYVGSGDNIQQLREIVEGVKIIAKIERIEALNNIEEIVSVSDAVMVARGDLRNEINFEEMPFIEKKIVDLCKKENKPSIIATGLLASMVKSEEPTRSEVTDIAYSISIGADALMLSNETAVGEHPLKAVKAMEKIIQETELHNSDLIFNWL